MKKFTPFGVTLLCNVYLINAAFYFLSLVLFQNRIIIYGWEVHAGIAWCVRSALLGIPVYLFFALRQMKFGPWVLAVSFHAFFVINFMLSMLENEGYLHALLRITGPYSPVVYSKAQLFVFTLGALVNVLILSYLVQRKPYFSLGGRE